MTQAQWRVTVGSEHQQAIRQAGDVPLKWAHDADTGAPRYIHDPVIVSKASRAVCPGCGSQLWAVSAGQPEKVRPTAHFRHETGTPRASCVTVSARLAAMHHMLSLGYIELPRRRMSARAVGFSGAGYEGWEELPQERVKVGTARMVDQVVAELTLADGRVLLVDLTGERTAGEDGQAIITINLSDSAMAEMDIEQLRSRLRVLPPMTWCSHWNDNELGPRAQANAAHAAHQAFDGWTAEDEREFAALLPPGCEESDARAIRRETLLHKTVKSILEQEKRINTPALLAMVSREAPAGYATDWDDHRVEIAWLTVPVQLEFSGVTLERGVGRIVPDVRGRLADPRPNLAGYTATRVFKGAWQGEDDEPDAYPSQWPETVLIEVAVTHRVDEEKLRRIQQLDLPTLELDFGSLGGTMTLEGLRRFVVDGLQGKRWLHHPVQKQWRSAIRRLLRGHPEVLSYRAYLSATRRPELLKTSASTWAERYLEALIAFFDANAIMAARRKAEGISYLEHLDEDSTEWAEVELAAEALEAHGLPGGTEHVVARTLVPRILSMKLNRGVSYAVSDAYQVVNAIMNIRSVRSTPWVSIYLIAARAVEVEKHFNAVQLGKFRAWKQEMVKKVDARTPEYLRTSIYDSLLGALFPEMARFLAHGKGRA